MSYQTGTATDIDDLLTKLSIFAQANGWTQQKAFTGSGGGVSSELYLSKGDSYFAFQAQVDNSYQNYHGVAQDMITYHLKYTGATGFDDGASYDGQPGSSTTLSVNCLQPNMTAYHFFTDPAKTYLHVAVETTANEFRHIIFGLCNKLGDYVGGEYCFSCHQDQYDDYIDSPGNEYHYLPFSSQNMWGNAAPTFHAEVDGQIWWTSYSFSTSHWYLPLYGNYATLGHIYASDTSNPVSAPNTFNQLAPLWSIPCGVIARSSTIYMPLGHFEDVRLVNMQYISPGESIILGSDEWVVFPQIEKKDPAVRDDLPSSGYLGIAYLKVP